VLIGQNEVPKQNIKYDNIQEDKIFVRKYNKWMTKDEFDALVKATENYKKQKIVNEKTENDKEFEELLKSKAYKYFKYTAVIGIIFSTLLLLDYYLPLHLKKGKIDKVTTTSISKENPFKHKKYAIVYSDVSINYPNKKIQNIKLSGDITRFLAKKSPVEMMQTSIFRIDVALKNDFLVFNTNNTNFKTFHWFLIIFILSLIIATPLSKSPPPIYYILINTTTFGIPVAIVLFFLISFLG
jgi:hypothetical protein